jgi:hypothetical protein
LLAALAAWVVAVKAVPQFMQNFAPGTLANAQLGQFAANGVAHSMQNLAPAGF